MTYTHPHSHTHTYKIGIIGLGYVGLPLAREFLKNGFEVIGFDIDEKKVKKINKGESYIKHIGDDFLKEYVIEKNKFKATNDFSKLSEVDFIIICVPTPLDEHKNPDLSYVIATAETISKYLRKNQTVVLESTTYPGTTEEVLKPILEKSGLRAGEDFCLGYSPEREDPGNKKFTTSTIPKVVSGINSECLKIINELYSQIIVKTVPVSSPKVAEATKILENTYRAVNIALVNELKMLFQRMGIDVWEVIEAAKSKPFGFHPFYPGPGLGGHCIPIDPFYLTWKAAEYDFRTRFIELAGEVNTFQPYYVVDMFEKYLNDRGISIFNAKVLIVGIAYKPDVDDMRESPSLKIMELLEERGVKLYYYDPYFPEFPETRKYNFSLKSISLDSCDKNSFDGTIISTDHTNIDYLKISEISKFVLDTRNAFRRHLNKKPANVVIL